jgi:hypothetical protein
MFSKIDALIIGALSLGGTSAMVEANNRVVIGPPEAAAVETVEASKSPAYTTCQIAALNGEFMFMHYASRGARTLPEAVTCDSR